MATFERTGPLKLERQLDGSATEAVRKRMGGDRDATNADQWKVAIDSYADRFRSLGLKPPRTSVVRGKGHADLWRLLHDQRRRVIAALHYGMVASEKRSLWASRSFRGNHAVYLRTATVVDEARRVPAYDPLADGRFKGWPNGRRLWPFWLVRAASGNVRDERGRRLYPAEDRWIGLVVSTGSSSARSATSTTTRGCDTSSHLMPWISDSAQHYRRSTRPVVTQVGLVGARGLAPTLSRYP